MKVFPKIGCIGLLAVAVQLAVLGKAVAAQSTSPVYSHVWSGVSLIKHSPLDTVEQDIQLLGDGIVSNDNELYKFRPSRKSGGPKKTVGTGTR